MLEGIARDQYQINDDRELITLAKDAYQCLRRRHNFDCSNSDRMVVMKVRQMLTNDAAYHQAALDCAHFLDRHDQLGRFNELFDILICHFGEADDLLELCEVSQLFQHKQLDIEYAINRVGISLNLN